MKKQSKILNLAILSLICLGLIATINYNQTYQFSNEFIHLPPNPSDLPLTGTQVVSWALSGHAYTPSIALDLEENTHIVWADASNHQSAGYDKDIFYRNRSASTGKWGPIEVLTLDETSFCEDPQLVADNAGDLHLVYHTDRSPYEVHYRTYSGGIWSSYENVSTESNGDAYFPDLAVDDSRNVHVVWTDHTDYDSAGTDGDIFYKNRTIAGLWSTTEVVSPGSFTLLSYPPSIECDGDGNPHIVWHDAEDITGTSNFDADIFYKNMTSSTGTWSSTVLVSSGSYLSSITPTIDIDRSSGIIHIAWCDDYDFSGETGSADEDVFYRNLTVSTNIWSPIELISWESDVLSKSDAELVLDGENLHVSYEENGHVYYQNRALNTSNWEERRHISSESTSPINPYTELIVSSSGLVQFVWGDYSDFNSSGTDADIFFREVNMLPDLTSPGDQSNLVTSTGNKITWMVTDGYSLNSPNYTIVWNTTNDVSTGIWTSGANIEVNIDSYHHDIGEYNFTLFVDDGHGDLINDSVWVTVYNEDPILTSPSDISYAIGSEGNEIIWIITDASADTYDYTVDRDGSELFSATWTSGEEIIVDIDSLEPGVYNYTIFAIDGFGGLGRDEVIVTVITSKSISLGYGVIIVSIIATTALVTLKKKKVKYN